jgi:UDPglucose 6-dehydrogenase
MKKAVAVIGQGFVGGSLTTVLSERGVDVYAFDKSGKYVQGALPSHGDVVAGYPNSIAELIHDNEDGATPNFSNIYFVCVPTPMFEDGAADISIVESVLTELSLIPGERIAVVKSTVPPGSTDEWNKKFSNTGLKVVFNPEFLTERSALSDMRNQSMVIIGGDVMRTNRVEEVFSATFPNVPIIKTTAKTAEMVKYTINNFFSVKVAFANEVYQICEALGVDYDKVIEYATYDRRMEKTHWKVPGPDGHFGYGGHCFPKDINAMIKVAESLGVDAKMLRSAWEKNLQIRPPEARNWETMVGRAVSKKKR